MDLQCPIKAVINLQLSSTLVLLPPNHGSSRSTLPVCGTTMHFNTLLCDRTLLYTGVHA